MTDLLVDLLPVSTLVLGWALNELHQVISARRGHGDSIRKALACLLEVRFRLHAMELVIRELKRRAPEAQEQMPQLRSILEALIGGDDQIHEKYQAAVDAVAAQDPFLAFELNSRSKISTFFKDWRNLALSSGAPGAELETLESSLKQAAGPRFDEILVSVAGEISCGSKRHTKRIVSRPFELPAELSALLDQHIPASVGSQATKGA